MPTYSTSQQWLEQSALLIKAYPSSTHVTSKYSVIRPTKSQIKKHSKRLARLDLKSKEPSAPTSTDPSATLSTDPPSQPPTISEPQTTASFTLKTYSPEAGVALKYTTNKAPEVGRLIAAAGSLGRCMAGLPELEVAREKEGDEGDVVMEDVAGDGVGAAGSTLEKKDRKAGGGGGGGGKKKKKKGKR